MRSRFQTLDKQTRSASSHVFTTSSQGETYIDPAVREKLPAKLKRTCRVKAVYKTRRGYICV